MLSQRRSHLFLVGEAKTESQRRECEHRRREAILGGSGGIPPPPPGNFLNKRCDFVHSGMILSSNFISFWGDIFWVFYPLIWQENIETERRNFVMAPMCFHTFFPGPRFFFFPSLSVWGVVGVRFK